MVLHWAILTVLLGTVTANGDSGGAVECKHTDKNENCTLYKDNKYCTDTKWGSWMVENCAKSCKCEGSSCVDKHSRCAAWSSNGECTKNPLYMIENCAKSCGKCGGTGGSSCVDKDTSCAAWSSNGECTKYPGYMNKNCAKSCGKCGGTGGSSCFDKDTRCAAWSSNGECTNNPRYMNENCAKSCGKCGGTGGTGTTVTPRPVVVTRKFGCNDSVKSYPSDLPNPDFYKKICYTAHGLKIISSNQVSDAALNRTAFLIDHVMQNVDPRVSKMMNRNKFRYAVIAAWPKEKTTTLPEHSYLPAFYNVRARGLGATLQNPLGFSAEENVMCHEKDWYRGQDITIHEFAHSLHLTGLAKVFPGFERQLRELYRQQRIKGIWRNTYADTDSREYFAEGVTSYFNAKTKIIPGISKGITRALLELRDPHLYNLVDTYLGRNNWKWSCP